MLQTSDQLPGFRPAGPIVSAALESLRPPRRIRISEAAEKHRRLNNPGSYVGPWRNAMAPYLVEPTDRFQDRAVEIVVLVGPSQFGKTEIPLNVVGHAAKYAAKGILIVTATKDLARDFSRRRIARSLIAESPDLADELGDERSDDTVEEKVFRNGTAVSIAWPTTSQLASRPMQVVIVDERDSMPDDIAGEGDPVYLARGRIKTFGSHGKVGVLSSPKREDRTGIVALYEEGDRCLWHVKCPHCAGYFTPGFDADRKPTTGHLDWEKGADAARARETAHLVCPLNGCVIEEREKAGMNATGVWLGEGQSIDADGTISGARRRSQIASYWFCGLASTFVKWGAIASALVTAERDFEITGDETKLKAVWNTDFGFPYRAATSGAPALTDADVAKRMTDGHKLRLVPAGAVCLVAAVDVQARSFEVMVRAFGEGLESWLVDRYSILQLADGVTRIDPAGNLAHWETITDRVCYARYPVAGGGSLAIMTTAVDTGGLPGVDPNARQWWWKARAAGLTPANLTLVKGGKDIQAPTVSRPTWLATNKDGKPNMEGPALFVANVHRIKDALDVRLRRSASGAGAIHFPSDLERAYLAEVTAEEKRGGVWEKLRPRNETWDLLVYTEAALIRHGGERSDLGWVPAWARVQAEAANVANAVRGRPATAHGVRAAGSPVGASVDDIAGALAASLTRH